MTAGIGEGVSCWQQYPLCSKRGILSLSQSHTRAPAIYPLQHSLAPLLTMADTSDPACSCSVHLAPFGALQEPRRRHAPPAPMAACRLRPPQSPPISQAIRHKARNTTLHQYTWTHHHQHYTATTCPTPHASPAAAECACEQGEGLHTRRQVLLRATLSLNPHRACSTVRRRQ